MGVSLLGFKITDDDLCSMKIVREILAEVIGTFYLIFIGCGAVFSTTIEKGDSEPLGAAQITHIAFAFGLGIGGAVHLFSDISGGQFNPAVSFGLFFARKLSLLRALIFSGAQLGGGILACAVLKLLVGKVPGVVEMSPHVENSFYGLLLEMFGTLFLVFTVLATTNGKRGHAAGYSQPLSIGIAIFVAHLALVPLTGCGINPARSLATNIAAGDLKAELYAYIVGPLLASVAGGLIYEFLFDTHYNSSATHEPLDTNGDEEMSAKA